MRLEDLNGREDPVQALTDAGDATIVREMAAPSGHEAGGVRSHLATAIRVAAVLAAMLIAWVAIALFRDRVLVQHMSFDAWRTVESILGGVFGVAIVVTARRRFDRRSVASLGLGWTRRDAVAFAVGAGLWTGLAAVGLAVGAGTGMFTVMLGPPTWTMLGWLLLQTALVLSYEAIPEELVLRGYVYTHLADRFPRGVAIIAQAVLFTLWAFALVTLLRAAGVGASWSIDLDRTILFLTFGVSLALMRLWTGSLWGSVGFHLAFQVGMGLLMLDRLAIVRVPSEDIGSAAITLWFFGIVLGGSVGLIGLMGKERKARRLGAIRGSAGG